MSIFESLASNTVADQMAAMDQAEGRGAEPVKAQAKARPAQAAAKPKSPTVTQTADDDDDAGTDDAEDIQTSTGNNQERDAILPDDEDESAEVTAEDESTAAGSDDADDGEAGSDSEDEDPENTRESAAKLKALEKDNFKTREKNRELREQLEKVQARVQELESHGQSARTPIFGMPAGFESVKTESDLDTMEQKWQQELEWAEDYQDEGYAGKNAQGEEVEYTPQQVRQYRRQVEKALKQTDKVRTVLKDRMTKEAAAKVTVSKKYPFVFDTTSRRHAIVQEIEAEHPEISLSPQRTLLLGRLAVAKLLESGAYELVRKGTQPAATLAPKVAQPSSPPPARRPAARSDQPESFASLAMSLAKGTVASLGRAA